jgi:2-polyprenyl-3-methyl-5-hydroxy-6-metoxy-1,4-benzoquinol methylase
MKEYAKEASKYLHDGCSVLEVAPGPGKARKSRLTEINEYAKEASKYLHDGCSVLEVAPGPGYLAIELAKLGICNKIIGLDISKDFVENAQRNAKEAGVIEVVEFQHGNVADILQRLNDFLDSISSLSSISAS